MALISPFLEDVNPSKLKTIHTNNGVIETPLPSYFRKNDFHKSLRELDQMSLLMLEDNEFIVKTEFEHEERVNEYHPKGNLVYVLRTKRVIPGKPKKPHPKKEDYASKKFLDVWREDGYIDELTEDHCLIFNKFAECDRHLLVITKR